MLQVIDMVKEETYVPRRGYGRGGPGELYNNIYTVHVSMVSIVLILAC